MLVVDPNRARLTRAALADRKAKRLLEIDAFTDFQKLFRQLGKDFSVFYKQTGHTLSLSAYKEDFESTLEDHYQKTADHFKVNVRSSLDPKLNARYHSERIADQIDKKVDTYIGKRKVSQTKEILATTKDQMDNALALAHIAAAEEGMEGNREHIAEFMRLWFEGVAAGRSRAISTTEVNGCAEFSKFVEFGVIKRNLPKKATLVVLEGKARWVLTDASKENFGKTWVADLDEKTRSWHAAVDFTRVDVDEPFVVNGEKMMHPGDDSLGASLENLINCRCSAIIAVEGLETISA